MAGTAIFVVGLPGSGKSELLRTLSGVVLFDDFKANAINHNRAFDHAQNLNALLSALSQGKVCVISDIDFCREEARVEAETYLRAVREGTTIEWRYFENNPSRCIANVEARAAVTSRNLEQDLRSIAWFSTEYRIPEDAKVLPVWDPSETV